MIGGGSIGLAISAVARSRGIDVDLAARYPHQHEAGEQLGAGRTLADEYDVVVDAAGSQASLDDAVARVRPGGTIVVAATYWDPVTIGTALLVKEVRLVPAAMYGHDHGVREFETAATLLAARPEIADALGEPPLRARRRTRGVPRLGRPRCGRDQGRARALTGQRP